MSIWLSNNLDGGTGTKLLIQDNGVDVMDYYNCKIVFDANADYNSDKRKTMTFIRNCSKENNFGGTMKNEYWLP